MKTWFEAVREGNTTLVETGVQGWKIDVNTECNGRMAIHMAVEWRHVEVIKYLLSQGADPVARCEGTGSTPLHLAAVHGNVDVATLLLKQNINPDIVDNDGGTALGSAIRFGNKDVIKILLEYDADPNMLDGEHLPLCQAVWGSKRDIVKLLLENGADPNELDGIGNNALSDAIRTEDPEIIHMLLSHGAVIGGRHVGDWLKGLSPAVVLAENTEVKKQVEEKNPALTVNTVTDIASWVVKECLKMSIRKVTEPSFYQV